MLARYNEFSTIHKPTEEAKEDTQDIMQIGQGSQTADNFVSNISSIPHFSPFANENLRYKQISLKDSLIKVPEIIDENDSTNFRLK
mmetsp:Transcript_7468/g.6612  ORF Transcript_7468/g.6612 Transcript_7468/m.6612 type:complete len:86 (-) Transcript_7468:409-666(-)